MQGDAKRALLTVARFEDEGRGWEPRGGLQPGKGKGMILSWSLQ